MDYRQGIEWRKIKMQAKVLVNVFAPYLWEVHSGGNCDMIARVDISTLDSDTRKRMIKALADTF